MTILNKSVLMAILTMVPFILFSQQDEFRLNHRSTSSNQNIIIDNIRESAVRFDKKQTFHNISILFRSRKIEKKESPFFTNVDMGLRYDSPYGGLGFFVQLDTKTFLAPTMWIGDDISHNRFLAKGGLKVYLPFIKIINNSSIYTQVSYGVITRNLNQHTIITDGGPVLGQWGEVLEIIEGSIKINKISYWTSGPSISAGMEYKLSKRFKINAEFGMSYIVSGDGESHNSVYPLLQLGVVNNYW